MAGEAFVTSFLSFPFLSFPFLSFPFLSFLSHLWRGCHSPKIQVRRIAKSDLKLPDLFWKSLMTHHFLVSLQLRLIGVMQQV